VGHNKSVTKEGEHTEHAVVEPTSAILRFIH